MNHHECYICPHDKGHLIKFQDNSLFCIVCNRRFEIIRDVPNFVTDREDAKDFSSETFSLEWSYFSLKNFKDLESEIANTHCKRLEGYENFDLEASFFETTGFNKDELKGKKILEVGTGSGRLLSVALKYGADCYGIDYSESVYEAWQQLRNLGYDPSQNRCHIARADLFSLPFREGYFDLIFSTGVLHHTPDTKRAFSCLPAYLRGGG